MQILNDREKIILEYLANGELKSIQKLSETLQVSTNTIRNDLKTLEEKGCVITIHGGALPAYYPEVLQRMNTDFNTKLKLAEQASKYIQDNDTIMISCGTTCSLVGRFLYGKFNVNLITHSTLFLPYARTNPNLNLILLSGEFLRQEDATSGIDTVQEIDNYYPRLVIVGSDKFSIESGLTTKSLRVSAIIKKMLSKAQKKILLVESRKFGEACAVKICSLEEIDIIITDSNLNTSMISELKKKGIEVVITNIKE